MWRERDHQGAAGRSPSSSRHPAAKTLTRHSFSFLLSPNEGEASREVEGRDPISPLSDSLVLTASSRLLPSSSVASCLLLACFSVRDDKQVVLKGWITHFFLLNQTQNWDPVSLMQLTIFIQEQKADGGLFFFLFVCLFFFCYVISIVVRSAFVPYKRRDGSYAPSSISLSVTKVRPKAILYAAQKEVRETCSLPEAFQIYIFYTSGDSRCLCRLTSF